MMRRLGVYSHTHICVFYKLNCLHQSINFTDEISGINIVHYIRIFFDDFK